MGIDCLRVLSKKSYCWCFLNESFVFFYNFYIIQLCVLLQLTIMLDLIEFARIDMPLSLGPLLAISRLHLQSTVYNIPVNCVLRSPLPRSNSKPFVRSGKSSVDSIGGLYTFLFSFEMLQSTKVNLQTFYLFYISQLSKSFYLFSCQITNSNHVVLFHNYINRLPESTVHEQQSIIYKNTTLIVIRGINQSTSQIIQPTVPNSGFALSLCNNRLLSQ